jgi:hypothetical protein
MAEGFRQAQAESEQGLILQEVERAYNLLARHKGTIYGESAKQILGALLEE